MWVMIDSIQPGQPCVINTDKCTDITWKDGTLTFETVDSKCIECECEQKVFIQIASALKPEVEVE